jgi:primosomal protein N' (replication factor Y)
MPPPEACPKCKAVDSFAACGPGVERLEEEAAALFPDARVLVLSSDLVASVERLEEEFSDIEKGNVDIVIGTQLIAKGHHFPKLSLAGIVDADLGLGSGDLRAAERSFQLLHQVLGRAGREAVRGHGLIQTHQPEHPVMQALVAGDRDAFYGAEIAARERGIFPPFGRLASLIVSGPDRAGAELFARRLAAAAPADAARVLGPAEAPIAVIRGRHRFRLLVKTKRNFPMAEYLRDWLSRAGKPTGGVRLEIDVDPQSFM